MKPALKFGLIGGVVALAVLIGGTFILADKPTLAKTFQYLLQLAIIISIIASIKKTQESTGENPLELKTGMKAGVITVAIICVFLGGFNFIYQQTIPKEELIKLSEESLSEHYKVNPVTDTTQKVFNAAKFSYDSAFKKADYRFARYMLERARIMRPDFDADNTKVKEVNEKMLIAMTSPWNQLSKIFGQLLFFQLLIGMFISFISTMLFRYRQTQGF